MTNDQKSVFTVPGSMDLFLLTTLAVGVVAKVGLAKPLTRDHHRRLVPCTLVYMAKPEMFFVLTYLQA
jgi:hypothetical protein